MIEMILIATLLLTLVLLLLALKGERRFVLVLLGYNAITSILVTVILSWLLAGTVGGLLSALLTGAAVSTLLLFAKKTVGYARWKRHPWRLVEHPATQLFTFQKMKSWLSNFL